MSEPLVIGVAGYGLVAEERLPLGLAVVETPHPLFLRVRDWVRLTLIKPPHVLILRVRRRIRLTLIKPPHVLILRVRRRVRLTLIKPPDVLIDRAHVLINRSCSIAAARHVASVQPRRAFSAMSSSILLRRLLPARARWTPGTSCVPPAGPAPGTLRSRCPCRFPFRATRNPQAKRDRLRGEATLRCLADLNASASARPRLLGAAVDQPAWSADSRAISSVG